jgi:hypothetical protein
MCSFARFPQRTLSSCLLGSVLWLKVPRSPTKPNGPRANGGHYCKTGIALRDRAETHDM